MDDRLSLFDRIFSIVIAFVLPGLVALVGTAAVNDTVHAWFLGARDSTGFVGLFFVLLAALALSLIVSAIRFVIFERAMRRWVPRRLPFDETKRTDHARSYAQLQADHYFHYLASGNMAVAVPIACVTWWLGSSTDEERRLLPWAVAFTLLSMVSLALAAIDAYSRYQHRRAELLPVPTRASDPAA